MKSYKVILFNAGGTLIQLKGTTLPILYSKILSDLLKKPITPSKIYEAFNKAEIWVLSRKKPGALFSDLDQRKYQNIFYNHLGITDRKEINYLEAKLAEMLDFKFELEKDAEILLENLSNYFDLGILSNWDESLINILEELGIKDYFKSITISEKIGINKPDLEIFKSALNDFSNIKPKDVVFLGDDYNFDIIPAKKMNMLAVLFDKGPTGMHGRPLYMEVDCLRIKKLIDFPKIIL